MNIKDNEVENVLRKPPQPQPPTGLKQHLTAHITLPAAEARAGTVRQNSSLIHWLRRWWPALAPATVSVACAAIMLAQQIEAGALRQSNQGLAKQLAEELTSVTRPALAGNGVAAEDGARTEQKEIARLMERAAELGSEVARLERMQAENETLRRKPVPSAGLTEDEIAGLVKAREKAQSIACINNLKQIGLAVRIWALDNKDTHPPNFLSMSNELNTPKILVCPAETNRPVAASFANYADENCTYEFLAPSADFTEPYRVLTRCPIHGHIGLCDGSVQSEVAKKNPESLVLRDNKLYLTPWVDAQPTPSPGRGVNESKP